MRKRSKERPKDSLHYGPYDDRDLWDVVLDNYILWPWTRWGLLSLAVIWLLHWAGLF